MDISDPAGELALCFRHPVAATEIGNKGCQEITEATAHRGSSVDHIGREHGRPVRHFRRAVGLRLYSTLPRTTCKLFDHPFHTRHHAARTTHESNPEPLCARNMDVSLLNYSEGSKAKDGRFDVRRWCPA